MHEKITQFLQERIDAGDFPSAVYLVAEKGKIVFHDALGNAVVEPKRIPAKLDTIYDLASLTKVLVSGLLLAILVDKRKIVLNESIAKCFSPTAPTEKAGISTLDLLRHTSGFHDWAPFYLLVKDRPAVLGEILRMPLVGQEWEQLERLAPLIVDPMPEKPEPVIYSDLNFIALTFLIESLLREPIDEAARRLIFDLLRMENTFFKPAINLRERIAASELGNYYERQTCTKLGYFRGDERDWKLAYEASGVDPFEYKWREYQIWGEVHDGNAWFMGGIAGHAGLFSTAEEVFKIALQFLPNYTTLLKHETTELFRTNFTKGMNEDRSFAFQLASTEGSTAGSLMPPESFGHNGFTGTSLWIDPVNERIFILLTNRTHAHPLPFTNINSVRRQFHDLAIKLI